MSRAFRCFGGRAGTVWRPVVARPTQIVHGENERQKSLQMTKMNRDAETSPLDDRRECAKGLAVVPSALVKLDQEGSDQILAAVRTLLPEGVNAYRKGSGNLIIKYKRARSERHTSSSPAFGHMSGRNSRAGALAIGYRRTLREITNFLTRVDLRWPGLAWGPVEIDVKVVNGSVEARLTDTEGHVIEFPTLRAGAEFGNTTRLMDPTPLVAAPVPTDRRTYTPAIPDAIAERIIAALVAAMPSDFKVDRHRRTVNFRSGGMVLNSDQTVRPVSWPQLFGPRNRDGVTQRSIGWATWMLLDGLLRMSRTCGAPIDKSTARRLQAYTQVRDNELHGWLAVPGDAVATVTISPVDLSDLTPEPPRGLRLGLPVLSRYRLPALGEVMTAPGNR